MVIQFFCPVCIDEYTALDRLSSTRCGHIFHSRCILAWLQRSTSCPLCKGETLLTDIFYVYMTSKQHESELELHENWKVMSNLDESIKSSNMCCVKLDEFERNFKIVENRFNTANIVLYDLQAKVESLEQKFNIKKKQETEKVEESVVPAECSYSLTNNNDNNGMPFTTIPNTQSLIHLISLDIERMLTSRERIIEDLQKLISKRLVVEQMKLMTLEKQWQELWPSP